jgi:predicted type IV restriction endonuclease
LRESRTTLLSEADTCVRVMRVLTGALGYDDFRDIVREFPIKSFKADIAVKIDGTVVFLVEAKQSSIKLKDKHVNQVASYAATEGIPWCVLTNGHQWQIYHISWKDNVECHLVLKVDVVDEALDAVAQTLFYLSKKAMKHKDLDEIWETQAKLTPANLLKALLEPYVLKAVRRQIKSNTKLVVDDETVTKHVQKLFDAEDVELVSAQMKRHRRSPDIDRVLVIAPDGSIETSPKSGSQLVVIPGAQVTTGG